MFHVVQRCLTLILTVHPAQNMRNNNLATHLNMRRITRLAAKMKHVQQWNVGKKIQEKREKLGISKREAARRAGISEAWWRQLENGYITTGGEQKMITIPVETVAQMMWAVGINAITLLDDLNEAGYTATEEQLLRGTIQARLATMNLAGLRITSSFLDSVAQNKSYL